MNRISIQSGELELALLPYGARIAGLRFKGKELALAYNDDADYAHDSYYLGASVGPIANRISQASLSIDGKAFTLPNNEKEHCLHGGNVGFDREIWDVVEQTQNSVTFELSYDLSKFFTSEGGAARGTLHTQAMYTLLGNTLVIEYRSVCDTDTYINPTNHVYLNLSGRSLAGQNTSLADHTFELYGDNYVEVDDQKLPTGELTQFDSPLEYRLSKTDDFSGFVDHHFNVRTDLAIESGGEKSDAKMMDMVRARSEHSGIELRVKGNSVGYQFCTSDFLDTPFAPSGGFCVETQHAPNAINQAGFYSPLLRAGVKRIQTTEFEFFGANA